MSGFAELLTDCDDQGIRLLPNSDGGLTIDAPRESLTPDLLGRIKVHKLEILVALPNNVIDAEYTATAEADEDIDWFDHIEDIDRIPLLESRQYPQPCRHCGCCSRHWSKCPTRFDDGLTSIPFGKHKGQRIDSVPNEYLEWFLDTAKDDTRTEIVRVLYLRRSGFGATY